MTQFATVVSVLALLGVTLWWLRRRGIATLVRRGSGRRLESIERLPLGPQHVLHMVRVDDATVLLSTSPGGCSILQPVRGGERGYQPGGGQ